MCGISGIIKLNDRNQALDMIPNINNSLKHRGPDGSGVWSGESVHLGHRRLSIIDLSTSGDQPMVSEDNNFVLVFNGEIYNFKLIRGELEAKGYRFRSSCDTEVVLYAYQEWGTDAFSRFNGMFALAIYDQKKNELTVARDHAGIKPLYYSFKGNQFLFASEVRAFKAYDPNWHQNPVWPVFLLSFGFIPFPYTTLDEVYLLPKGTFLKLNLDSIFAGDRGTELESGLAGGPSSGPVWTTDREIRGNTGKVAIPFHNFTFSHNIKNENLALTEVRAKMLSAVDSHMISDAPLGIFLSGGIDSSLCALLANHLGHKDLNTLSITFKEATFNEEPYQKIVLQKMRPHHHQEYKVDEQMFMDYLDDVFSAMDQPSWDGVNSYFISKCAHEAGLKAVLSGLGGDELLGGYPSFQRITLLDKLKKVPSAVRMMGKYAPNDAMKRLMFLNTDTEYKEYLFLRGAFTPDVVSGITGLSQNRVMEVLGELRLPDYPQERNANVAAYLESNVYMENQLLKDTDYMSMWHSLEVRVPFLDKALMELLWQIDPAVKFQFSQPKYLLTKAFEDILPPEIVFRQKQGFTFPFSIWLKSNMDFFKKLMPDTPVTEKLIKGFLSGKVHWSRIWALIVYKRFMS